MTRMTRAELQAAWQSGEIHGVGYSVGGEANVEDIFDSAVLYDDALIMEEDTHYGKVTLSSGSAFVSSTIVEADTYFWLTVNSPSGTVGSPYVHTIWAGGSFLVKSTSATDNSTVAYMMIDPDW